MSDTLNYELLWKQMQKHVQAVNKRTYSRADVLNMMYSFEYAQRKLLMNKAYNTKAKAGRG